MTEAGRLARIAFADRWVAELQGIDASTLDDGEAIDRDLLLGELAEMRFDDETLREETWNPLAWVYLIGAGIFPLLAREFAPLHVRLASVASRLEGVPALIASAQDVMGTHPTRPVSAFMAEHAAKRIGGISSLADDAVRMASDAAANGDAGADALLPRLRAAADGASVAIAAIGRHLAEV